MHQPLKALQRRKACRRKQRPRNLVSERKAHCSHWTMQLLVLIKLPILGALPDDTVKFPRECCKHSAVPWSAAANKVFPRCSNSYPNWLTAQMDMKIGILHTPKCNFGCLKQPRRSCNQNNRVRSSQFWLHKFMREHSLWVVPISKKTSHASMRTIWTTIPNISPERYQLLWKIIWSQHQN